MIFFSALGKCISRFTNSKTPYCIRFNPDEDKSNLFVVGCADKKIYTVSSLSTEDCKWVKIPMYSFLPLARCGAVGWHTNILWDHTFIVFVVLYEL